MVRINRPVKTEILNSEPEKSVIEDGLKQDQEKKDEQRLERKFNKLINILVVSNFLVSLLILSFTLLLIFLPEKPDPLLAVPFPEISVHPNDNAREIIEFNQEVGGIELDDFTAHSYMGFNPVTQQIYISSNADSKSYIASITKLISSIVALDYFSDDDLLRFTAVEDERMATILGLQEGDLISFKDALTVMLVASNNDVAYMVADNYRGGYEKFVSDMNVRAGLIGMEDTHFENPAGFDHPEHFSTANDLKKLVMIALKREKIVERAAIKSDTVSVYRPIGEIPDIQNMIKLSELDLNRYEKIEMKIDSTNELLGEERYLKGLKTGYTTLAGPSFVSYYEASEVDQLVTILLNGKGDRFELTKELVEAIRKVY